MRIRKMLGPARLLCVRAGSRQLSQIPGDHNERDVGNGSEIEDTCMLFALNHTFLFSFDYLAIGLLTCSIWKALSDDVQGGLFFDEEKMERDIENKQLNRLQSLVVVVFEAIVNRHQPLHSSSSSFL